MSPLKIALLLRMYSQPRPNRGLPERQAFAPAMHEALRDFKSLGLAHPLLTIVDLQAGTGPAEKLTAAGRQLVDLHRNVQAEIAARDARIAELESDRRVLQSTGEHPAPCARHCEANAFQIELRNKDARIAQVEAALAQLQRHYHAAAELHSGDGLRITELEAEVLSWQKCCREGQEMLNAIGRQLGGQIPEQLVSEVARQCMDRIAELEKQAAIDKTLLALADARINRELRDDFAGRAMQGLLARPGGGYTPAMAYAMADEMLKVKGGA